MQHAEQRAQSPYTSADPLGAKRVAQDRLFLKEIKKEQGPGQVSVARSTKLQAIGEIT